MIPKGLFSNVLTLILSLAIIVTFVKPGLEVVGKTQETIALYQGEREKVTAVNAKLNQLVSSIDSLPQSDYERLTTYMPNEVDPIVVPRDIEAIATQSGVILLQVRHEGAETAPLGDGLAVEAAVGKPEAHSFTLEVEGSYSQIKQLLASFEQHKYPLEVHELQISKKDGGFLSAKLKLFTYQRLVPIKEPIL